MRLLKHRADARGPAETPLLSSGLALRSVRSSPSAAGTGRYVVAGAASRLPTLAGRQTGVPIAFYLALPLLVLAPALTFIALRRFDGLYGQDSYAYYDYALGSLRGALLARAPWPPFFWPPGYPLLLALASFALGTVAGQVVSLIMGALTPLLTALLVRDLQPRQRWLPLLAGALVALSGQLWQSSMVLMADTTGLAMATLSAWAVVRYARGQQFAWLLLATLSVVLALLSRWIYGLVALPLALYVLAGKPRAWHVVVATLIGVALLVPILSQPLLGMLRDPAAPATFAGNLQVYSWSPLNALRNAFDTPDGHLSYARPNGVYYLLAPANPALFGPLLAPWIAIGLVVALRSWSARAVLLVVGWAAVVYLFHAGAPWQNFRFTLAYVPPLAILIAAGLCLAGTWLGTRPISVWLLAGAAMATIGGVRLVDGFVERQQQERALVPWTEAQLPSGARLLTFGPSLTFQHLSHVPTADLFDLPDSELQEAGPTYLLVDVANLQEQWQAQRPGELYQRLRDGPGLQLLGDYGGFSLYRIGTA